MNYRVCSKFIGFYGVYKDIDFISIIVVFIQKFIEGYFVVEVNVR